MKYKITNEPLPVLETLLEPGEMMQSEAGAMSWRSPNIRVETTSAGGLGKMFGRALSGESLFLNYYYAEEQTAELTFTSCFPGQILPLQIDEDHQYICQKQSFLCGTSGVELSVAVQKKLSTGLFGGEGFVMQKLSGNGVAFLEIDGAAVHKDLAEGERLIVSSGYLAVMDTTCSIDIQSVGSAKRALFGGEGIFNTVITGPGHVILQSMPTAQLAHAIQPYVVTTTTTTSG